MKILLLFVMVGTLLWEQHQLAEERWQNMRLRSALVQAEWIRANIVDYCDALDRLNAARGNGRQPPVDFQHTWALNSLRKPRQQ